MSVRLRPGSPHYQIEFKYRGERIRQSSGTASRRLAEEAERKLRHDLYGQRVLGRSVAMTLQQGVDRYISTVITPRGNPEAAEREQWAFKGIVRLIGPETPLEDLTGKRLAAFRDKVIELGRAPATANKYLAMLRAMLTRAHREWGALSEIPQVRLFKLNNARQRWLTDGEQEELLRHCPEHLANLVIFLTGTGARLSEALNLKWEAVDLKRVPRPMVSFLKTKSGKPRSVPLTNRVSALLVGIKTLAESRTIAPGHAPFVFIYAGRGRGGRGLPKGMYRSFTNPHGSWRTACQRAGISEVRLHDLRHTFASRLVMRGVPLLTVSKLLGHASITMTLRYSHLAPDALDTAIKQMDGDEGK